MLDWTLLTFWELLTLWHSSHTPEDHPLNSNKSEIALFDFHFRIKIFPGAFHLFRCNAKRIIVSNQKLTSSSNGSHRIEARVKIWYCGHLTSNSQQNQKTEPTYRPFPLVYLDKLWKFRHSINSLPTQYNFCMYTYRSVALWRIRSDLKFQNYNGIFHKQDTLAQLSWIDRYWRNVFPRSKVHIRV